MSYFLNGVKTTKSKLLKWLKSPFTKVTSLTIELNNSNKTNGPVSMEGFDISSDYLISMAEYSNKMNSEITATFENCGKLGGKTVIITVK